MQAYFIFLIKKIHQKIFDRKMSRPGRIIPLTSKNQTFFFNYG